VITRTSIPATISSGSELPRRLAGVAAAVIG
jgi:hypothetical protein